MRRQTIVFLCLTLCVVLAPTQASSVHSERTLDERNEGMLLTCGYALQVQLVPSSPTPNDAIHLIYSGEWPDSCVPQSASYHIRGHVIWIDLVADYPPDKPCLAVILPWYFDIDVGRLPEGFYVARLYITDPWSPTAALCATTSFSVRRESKRHIGYLPIIAEGCSTP